MNSMWAFIIRTALLLVVPMASSELFTDDASIDSLKETRIIGGSEVSNNQPYRIYRLYPHGHFTVASAKLQIVPHHSLNTILLQYQIHTQCTSILFYKHR